MEFCQRYYFNPECSGKNEFVDDLKRMKYIKRLLQKIHKHKTLKSIRERLIINHLIKIIMESEKIKGILDLTLCYPDKEFFSFEMEKATEPRSLSKILHVYMKCTL